MGVMSIRVMPPFDRFCLRVEEKVRKEHFVLTPTLSLLLLTYVTVPVCRSVLYITTSPWAELTTGRPLSHNVL